MNVQGDGGGPSWSSKGPYKIHQLANRIGVARNTGGRLDQKQKGRIKALNAATVYADGDRFQTGEYSYRHGMRNQGESIAQAREKANEYVRFQFAAASSLLANGDEYNAYFEFGLALHALQDATSPGHGGFKQWSGKETVWEQIAHVMKEISYPGLESNLQKVTNTFLDFFEQGKSLPEGNLFDSINSD